jgi:hypothetical protein
VAQYKKIKKLKNNKTKNKKKILKTKKKLKKNNNKRGGSATPLTSLGWPKKKMKKIEERGFGHWGWLNTPKGHESDSATSRLVKVPLISSSSSSSSSSFLNFFGITSQKGTQL